MSILLMTGTISPQVGARELLRIDVGARIEDYRRAMSHNIELLRQHKIDALVFIENSGYGMAKFADFAADAEISDRLEMISYDAAQPQGQTRFAGECHLLRYAFLHSQLIRKKPHGHVWKITGRYIVQNLTSIMSESEDHNDLVVHCRNYPMRYVDFGLVGFRTRSALDILNRILETEAIDGMDERMVRDMIDQGRLADLRLQTRFNRIPDFSGFRGSDNSSYSGLRYRAQYFARCILHRAIPQIWI